MWYRLRIGLALSAIATFMAGFALSIPYPRWAIVFYAWTAGFGLAYAVMILVKAWVEWRFKKTHPMLPTNLAFDPVAGVAFVGTLSGELVSVAVPEEVTQEGPDAVMAFVLHELKA